MPSHPSDETLRLVHQQLVDERDRLRAARSFFARQLGPLPAFAGLSAAVVGAFSDHLHHRAWMWIALGVLALLVVVSLLYSGLPAYRHLRARYEQDHDGARRADRTPEQWYRDEIALETALLGVTPEGNRLLPPSWSRHTDLQTLLDRERTGVFAAQALFVVVIACLFAARL